MIGKILTRLFALFGMTLTCVACYGIQEADYNPHWRATGRVVDEDNNPIPGIKVSLGHTSEMTDEDGNFYINGGSSELYLEDVDGEANGGEFEMQFLSLKGSEEIVGDVQLKRKEK
mgnify:FL=1|jgi:hypothetical protein